MIKLLMIQHVIHSVLVYKEMDELNNPLYREARAESLKGESMATHRSYIAKLLSNYEQHDDVQIWLIHSLAALINRVTTHGFTEKTAQYIKRTAFPVCNHVELQEYRQNLLNLLI